MRSAGKNTRRTSSDIVEGRKNMAHRIEKRTTKASVLAGDSNDFELVGLAASYNTLSGDVGGFKEVIAPGAFKRSLENRDDVRCLVNHDNSQILGRTKSGTLTLSDSPEGLRFLCKLNPESEAHRNVYAAVQRGDLDQCSFAFAANGEHYDNVKDASGRSFSRRTVTDLRLFDVSVVTFPAYPNGTRVQARSANYSPARVAVTVANWADLRSLAARQAQEIRLEACKTAYRFLKVVDKRTGEHVDNYPVSKEFYDFIVAERSKKKAAPLTIEQLRELAAKQGEEIHGEQEKSRIEIARTLWS
jgi:HK97 family phage prohead protease